MAATAKTAGWRGKFAGFALMLSAATIVFFAVAALGTRFGLWSWQFGLLTLVRDIGSKLAFAALGVGVLALIIALVRSPRQRPAMLAIGAIVLAGLVVGRLATFAAQAGSVPPIHDIQTNWEEPIEFSTILMRERATTAGANPVVAAPTVADYASEAYAGRPVPEVQAEAEEKGLYQPLETLVLESDVPTVARIANRLANERGWKVVTRADTDQNRVTQLEATETSAWFGFKDDIAIRIWPDQQGKVYVDARSVSRVGLSDLGVNAQRINAFFYDLQREVRGAQGS